MTKPKAKKPDVTADILNAVKTLAENGTVSIFVATHPDAAHRLAKVNDAYAALADLKNAVREKTKYGNPNEEFKSPGEALDWVYAKIWEVISERALGDDNF